MNGKMESFVAVRYLRGKRKIGFVSWITYISAAGVCLGTFVLVIALSIANGFESEVRERIVSTLAHAKVSRLDSPQVFDYEALRQTLLTHPQVESAAPYITGKGGIEHRNRQEGIIINGVDAQLEPTVTDIHKALVDGTFSLDTSESTRGRRFPGVLIGSGMAAVLQARIGAEVVLYSLPMNDGQEDLTPKMGRFTVTGIFETGMYEYDRNLVYISITSAQNMLNMDGVEGVHIRTTELFKANEIAKDVEKFLNRRQHTGAHIDILSDIYMVTDWQTQNRSLFEWMKIERVVIFVVISLIIVVAAFNIISSLIMMILEKRREIGILMSMGATPGAIMRVFMFNGIIVGFFGSLLGTTLGVILGYTQYRWRYIPIPGELYFINTLPMEVRTFDVVVIFIAANVICWLATLYPARQAAMLLPAESIRYE